MYVEHFGLKGRPFQLTPDPRFYFESATHRKAMSYLGYGLAQGEGFIVITGDIGAGKTTLVGHLMATIDPQRLAAVKIAASEMDGDTALRLAAQAFGIATDGVEKAHVLSRLEAFMHHQARAGRRSLLIVDEAQTLSFDALEALRMLSNFQLGGQSLVQIFLLGQPEFRELLTTSPELEQLRQRVIATHHLEPMHAEEVRPYIEHRLKIVGWTGNPRLEPEIFARMAETSGGVPRLLNSLAQNVMDLAAKKNADAIDLGIVEAVCKERENIAARSVKTPPKDKAPPPAKPVEATPPAGTHREAIRAEVQSLKAAIDQVAAASAKGEDRAVAASSDMAARMTEIEGRLAQIETRLGEQDHMLRTVLAKMIEWVERDESADAVAHRAA